MTTMRLVSKRCGVCYTGIKYFRIGSTCSFGSPDLDLRPAEMQRSTMSNWVHSCPKCGYVAYDISKKPSFDKSYLFSEEYITCGGIEFLSELAKIFYRKALLALKENDIKDAYANILCAAWCCDDCRDKENAILCRKKTDELYEQAPVDFKNNMNNKVRHIDVLRRAMLFDKAIAMCDEVTTDNELFASIIKFEKAKCIEKDTKVYTVESIVKKGDTSNDEF